jgi:hypothetical protein
VFMLQPPTPNHGSSFDHFIHVPSFQAGPLARALTRKGPGAHPGLVCRPARTRAMGHTRRLRDSPSPASTHEPLEGHPTARAGAGGEGLPQTTPLLSVWGCKWVPIPLGSMNTPTYSSFNIAPENHHETQPKGEDPCCGRHPSAPHAPARVSAGRPVLRGRCPPARLIVFLFIPSPDKGILE